MVKWGSVDVPELEYRQTYMDPANNHPEPGTVHLPTGLRIKTGNYEERGHWVEYLLHAPPGKDWTAKIVVSGMTALDNRAARYAGVEWLSDLPPKEQTTARNSFLRECGQEYFCEQFIPETGSDTPVWTDEQRDAILLMLFWELDRPIPVTAKVDPYPSTIQFIENVPELFLGIFRNPVSARLS